MFMLLPYNAIMADKESRHNVIFSGQVFNVVLKFVLLFH